MVENVGHRLRIKNVNLHEICIIEKVEFEKLSSFINYKDVSNAPSKYESRKFTNKSIIVSIRIIESDRNKVKEKIEDIVATCYSDKPAYFLLDNKYWCEVVLERASDELFFNTGLLTLEFTNIYGVFYGTFRRVSLPANIEVPGVIDTNMAKIKLTPTSPNGSVGIESDVINFKNVITNREIVIDLNKKIIKQLGSHVEISLDSSFFILKKGNNNINITNAEGVIEYREVVLL